MVHLEPFAAGQQGWLKFAAAVLGFREHEGGGNQTPLAGATTSSQSQASQPPPPYDVSMYCMEYVVVLITTVA